MIATVKIVQISIVVGDFLAAAEDRVRQFMDALTYHPTPDVDARLQGLLDSDELWILLSRLSPYDRAHHLKVWKYLRQDGQQDPDLLQAALLHDVGKADEIGQVRLVHRVALVLGRRIVPRLLAALTTPNSRCCVHGLYLAEHHARLGAKLACEAGASQRSCYLIAMHEQPAVESDAALHALIAADREAHR